MTPDPTIDAIVSELRHAREVLRRAVDRVPPSARRQRPAPDRWSAAEVVEHLAIVERRIGALVAEMAESAPLRSEPLAPHSADAAAQRAAADRASLLDRSYRVEAPPVIRPSGEVDIDAAWAMLERSREALLATLDAARGRDLGAVTRPHARFGPLDGYKWLAFAAGHEERHAAQVAEIADQLVATSDAA